MDNPKLRLREFFFPGTGDRRGMRLQVAFYLQKAKMARIISLAALAP